MNRMTAPMLAIILAALAALLLPACGSGDDEVTAIEPATDDGGEDAPAPTDPQGQPPEDENTDDENTEDETSEDDGEAAADPLEVDPPDETPGAREPEDDEQPTRSPAPTEPTPEDPPMDDEPGYGDLPPPAVDVETARSELVGLSLADAEAWAKAIGMTIRVVKEDGVDLAVTMDFSTSRLNVASQDGTVTEVFDIG